MQKKLFCNDYYNTTHLNGEELEKRKEKAQTQEIKVYNFFKANPEMAFTPFDVEAKIGDGKLP